MSRRVLITGGTGFIGAHLARALIDAGDTVSIADNGFRSRRDEAVETLVRDGVTAIESDLARPEELRRLGGPYDEIYHLAAIVGVRYADARPADVLRTNVLITVNLLDWLRQVGTERLLFSSTSEVYAATVDRGLAAVPTPEDVLLSVGDGTTPRYSYGLSKIVGEMLVRECARRDNYAFTTVRLHNVYGPRMGHDHVVPQVLDRIARRERPFRVYGSDQRRAFCYVADAVAAIRSLARSSRAVGAVVNVGNDREEIAIRDLVALLFAVTGYDAPIDEQPAPPGSVDRRCPDLTKLRATVGDVPFVPLGDGLRATAEWYRREAPITA